MSGERSENFTSQVKNIDGLTARTFNATRRKVGSVGRPVINYRLCSEQTDLAAETSTASDGATGVCRHVHFADSPGLALCIKCSTVHEPRHAPPQMIKGILLMRALAVDDWIRPKVTRQLSFD